MASRFEMTDFIDQTVANPPKEGLLRAFGNYAAQLSGAQKAYFFMITCKSDPAAKSFFYGHAISSSAISTATIGACLAIDIILGTPDQLIARAAGALTALGVLSRIGTKTWARAMDVEYTDWRMGQRSGVVAPAAASAAGLVNGCKHNTVSATLRFAAKIICSVAEVLTSIPSGIASGANFFFSPEKKWEFTRKANALHTWFDKMGDSVLGKTTFVSGDFSRSEVPAKIAEWHAAPKGKSSQPA